MSKLLDERVKRMGSKQFLRFGEAREFVRSLGLKSRDEWNAYSASEKRPSNIPSSPHQFYGNEWAGYGDFLGTGNPGRNREFLPFKEAREFVRSLGLKTYEGWNAYSASGKRPSNIPSSPHRVYGNEWEGYGDFLGTGKLGRNRKFLSFEEAREFVRSLGLKTYEGWNAYCQSGRKPNNVPSSPIRVYKQWAGIGDWLGIGKTRFRSFRAARRFVRDLGLRNHKEWRDYCRSGKKPNDIPVSPDHTYEKNWAGYGDFLGTGKIANKNRRFLPFKEAREYVRRLGFKSKKDWDAYAVSKAKPGNIPYAPWQVYRREWLGHSDWLGNLGLGNRWTPRAIEAYLKSIAREIPNMRDASLVKLIKQAGLDAPLAQLLAAPSMQRVIEALRNERDEIQARLRARRDMGFEIIRAPEPRIVEDEDFEHDEIEVDANNIHIADRLAKVVPPEFREYLIQENVTGLIQKYINGNHDEVRKILGQSGGKFYREIKERFQFETRGISEVDTSSWKLRDKKTGEKTEPNLMQRYISAKMKRNRSWCNWSKTGAGKTGSAGLASYVTKSRLTVVLCPNPTVDQWAEELTLTFHNCRAVKSTSEVKRGKGSFLVLNYEKFQLGKKSDALVDEIVALRPDLVVLDEVQLVKHREKGRSSIRRGAIEAMLARFPKSRVLGMTATPVINELREGVSLLEVVTRKRHVLRTRGRGDGAVMDALNLHFALMQNGLRYSPQYKQALSVEVKTVRDDSLLPLLQTAAKSAANILSIERTLLPAKLDTVRKQIKPGTVIYLEYVEGLVPVVRRFVESLGLTVGEYIGETPTSERRNFKNQFLSGEVDVLIGSRAIGLGVDGLQRRCNRLIILSLPWTHAAFEQVIGRVYRQGSTFAEVEVLIPQVVVNLGGELWSWDEARYSIIEHKKTLSDAAADGYVPTAENVSRNEFAKKAMDALKLMVGRVGAELPESVFATVQDES
jgi:superfamily II DNA or RNA helicase